MTDAIWKLRGMPQKEAFNSIKTLEALNPTMFAEIPCLHDICEHRKYLPLHICVNGGLDITDEEHDEHYQEWVDAGKLIIDQIRAKKPILISGDYDVDGMTATATLYTCLRKAQANVSWFIPDRETDGYGIAYSKVVERAKTLGEGTLIITVDSGIRDIEDVDFLKQAGFKVLITDHHIPDEVLPNADHILNLKCTRTEDDDEYMASGCYVAAKLGLYVVYNTTGFDEHLLNYCESLTGLSLVSDVIDLNPLMWHTLTYGLVALGNTTHAGLRALLNLCCHKENNELTYRFLAFNIVPKLNSAGRMSRVEVAMKLLLLENDASHGNTDSLFLANELKTINSDRKILERLITEEAISLLESQTNSVVDLPSALIVYQPHWKSGIVGIVAAKLVEATHVPVIVLTGEGDTVHGSGRAPANYDLMKGLDATAEYIKEYGGHRAACGITIDKENLDKFRDAFVKFYDGYKHEPFTYYYDSCITLTELQDVRFQTFLANLEPTGPKNEPLVLRIDGVTIGNYFVKRNTTYFTIAELDNKRNILVSKYMADPKWDDTICGRTVDILVQANINYFGGVATPVWEIVDIFDHEYEGVTPPNVDLMGKIHEAMATGEEVKIYESK